MALVAFCTWYFFVEKGREREGSSEHCGYFSSILGLYPPNVNSTLLAVTIKNIFRCYQIFPGDKIALQLRTITVKDWTTQSYNSKMTL
jgi:hypothetical protein